MDLKEVIQDSAKYPDSTTIKIGDAEVPLSSLRALSARQQQELEQGITKNRQIETELEAKRREVMDLSTKAQEIYNGLTERQRAAADAVTTSIFDDPVYQPVKKEFDSRDARINAQEDKIAQLTAAISALAQVGMADREERQFESVATELRKRDKYKDWDLPKLKKYAEEKNKKDRFGLIDLRAAVHDLTEDDRVADETKRAMEEGIEKGKRIALASRIQQPSTNQGFIPRVANSDNGEATLDNLESEILKDPELSKMWQATLSGEVA